MDIKAFQSLNPEQNMTLEAARALAARLNKTGFPVAAIVIVQASLDGMSPATELTDQDIPAEIPADIPLQWSYRMRPGQHENAARVAQMFGSGDAVGWRALYSSINTTPGTNDPNAGWVALLNVPGVIPAINRILSDMQGVPKKKKGDDKPDDQS
jgi:hypothetical protein